MIARPWKGFLALLVAVFAASHAAATRTGPLTDFLSDINHVIRIEEERVAESRVVEQVEVPATREATALVAQAEVIRDEPVYIREFEMTSILREKLKEHYQISGDFRVTMARNWRPYRVSSIDWDVDIVRAPQDGPESVSPIRLRLISAGKTVGELSRVVNCELWVDAWRSTFPMAKRQPLSADVMEIRRIDLLRSRSDIVPTSVDLAQYEVRQGIASDRILSWRDITLRPHVRRGDSVDVLVGEGTLQINMKALALENGAAGDFITVRNTTSNKSFQARVIREKTVQVVF